MLERLAAERGAAASRATLWRFLDRCGLTLQKSRRMRPNQERADVLKWRGDWIKGHDETWASTNMARLRGRAPKGERAAIPHGHWKTTTFVAGLQLSGMAAPMVFERPINCDAFQAYVDQILVPPRR